MTTASIPTTPVRHNKVVIICLLATVLGPLLFAWMLYRSSDVVDFQQKRSGDLIQPPVLTTAITYQNAVGVSVSGQDLIGRWWMVYAAPENCQANCQHRLWELRQLHEALGKHADKVGRIYLTDKNSIPTWLGAEYPKMLALSLNADERLHYFMAYALPAAKTEGAVFFIDPQGHIMMQFSHQVEAKGILADMKRLLRINGGHA